MNIKIINGIAVVKSDQLIIKDAASAIDFVMDIKHQTTCHKVALNKTAITENFLSSAAA